MQKGKIGYRPDKCAAWLPRTGANFDRAGKFSFYLLRKLYTIYREKSESRLCLKNFFLPGKCTKFCFVRPWVNLILNKVTGQRNTDQGQV